VPNTGDHISRISETDGAVQLIERLSMVGETYVVWGNHDIWESFNSRKYLDRINEIDNATVLVNESVY